MSNKKIYKNRLSLPIFDNKGIGNGNGIAYIPNVIRGGSAIPIGNNMFLMRGRSHAQGGIDIGRDLEVEGNEVVQNGKFGTKVFSSVPFLRGVSPAERVLRGENPDTVFAAQETWKRVNKVADDGSKRAALGISFFKPSSPSLNFAGYLHNGGLSRLARRFRNIMIGASVADSPTATGIAGWNNVNGDWQQPSVENNIAPNTRKELNLEKPINTNVQETTNAEDWYPSDDTLDFIKNSEKFVDHVYDDGKGIPTIGYGLTASTPIGRKALREYANKKMPKEVANEFFNQTVKSFIDLFKNATPNFDKLTNNQRNALFSYYYNVGHGGFTTKSPKLQKALRELNHENILKNMDFDYNNPEFKGARIRRDRERNMYRGLGFVDNVANKQKRKFGGMKLNIFKLGGLSRSKDYGSKDKPYPSVDKNDFAGGGRSYPIPTRADAVDALRLAGLHHRSDVRAKVYAKYPDLRKKAKLGKYAKITGSPTNEKVVEPVRTNYVERNNSSDNLGVGIGTILGGGATLSGLGYAGNKLYDKVLEYNSPTAKKAREYSKFLEKRAADKRAVAKAIADRQKTLNTTYGDKISKELNKNIKKGFTISPNQPSLNEKRITEFPNSKSTRFEYYDERANAALQNRKTAAFNSIKRARFLNPLYRIAPVAAAIDFVKNLFPSKQQEQEEDKAWRRYKSPTGRIPEDYQMKFGGRKKAPYGDYITIGGRRVPLVFDTDNKWHDISDVWDYLRTNPNPGDLAVNQYEENPLFRGFYHSENRPMFSTNPTVARWYNYGWSHNAGAEVPNYADKLANVNPPKPVVTNTSRGRNTNSVVSSTVQRILDNAEIAPYQNFRTPSLTEVASRYPISKRINVGTGTAPISSSTGVQPNPTDVEAVRSGNFAGIDNDRYLPIRTTTEDWVGLGANLLGSIGSYLGTRAMLNRYPMPNRSVPAIAQKLKTRININPQLDTIREQVGRLNTSIDNNTSSSRVAQARKQGVMNNAVASRNQLYGQKENAETQLINQDIMNRQRIGLYNNQIYNDYLNRLGSTRQYLANARISNFNNVLSGANQSIQDLLGRIENRDADRRNFIFMEAAYPNVNWRNIFQGNPELARSLGFRFVN